MKICAGNVYISVFAIILTVFLFPWLEFDQEWKNCKEWAYYIKKLCLAIQGYLMKISNVYYVMKPAGGSKIP